MIIEPENTNDDDIQEALPIQEFRYHVKLPPEDDETYDETLWQAVESITDEYVAGKLAIFRLGMKDYNIKTPKNFADFMSGIYASTTLLVAELLSGKLSISVEN